MIESTAAVVTDKSIIITFAIPAFFILILIEYFYGKFVGKNTYRLNDTFTSISLGMISRYPTMLNLGVQSLIFVYVSKYMNVGLLSVKNPFTKEEEPLRTPALILEDMERLDKETNDILASIKELV